MARNHDRLVLVRRLQWVTAFSLAAALALLLVAAVLRDLGTLRAQVLLTFVALFFGSLLMQVQLRARRRAAPGLSILLAVGVVVILISQASFLVLVWTNWKTSTFFWRVWWISMVPSVFVTHLILLHAAAGRQGGAVELGTGICVLWAGLMILWLGLRRDMLAGVSPAYLWVGALPAAGTVIGSLWVVARRYLRRQGPRGSRRAVLAGTLAGYLVVAVAAFYLGRATAGGGRELAADPNALLDSAGPDVRRQLGKDRYDTVAGVATFLGDTRIVNRPPFITPRQVLAIQPRLRPGDIILERRNWYLSNPMLPGFWPHAALYIGGWEDLKRLGIVDQPAVRARLAEYLRPAPDGQPHAIIEAVSEGVVLTSLTHSLNADYVAVLRPRLSQGQIAPAIVRAFQNLGKPYDFNFDFDDTAKLVCTQLVYVSYQGMLDFKLVRILGRNTLPANELARQYVASAGRADRQLDFVLFLDADPAHGTAFEADEAAFRQSIARPRELGERP